MYQLFLFDALGDGKAQALRSTIEARVRELHLDPAAEFEFLSPGDLARLKIEAVRVGVLLTNSSAGQAFANEVKVLLDSPAVVIPAVLAVEDFHEKVPEVLRPTNALTLDKGDQDVEKLAGRVLELFGLLRKRRRLFISYKRTESSPAAQQLYHVLDERSYDVFLDTLSVQSGDDFQEQLWHRMSDADIVILLYTPSIHTNRWTREEVQKATGMKITVLQLIWPCMKRDPVTSGFEALYLCDDDFDRAHPGQLKAQKATEIAVLVEKLRARSQANRQAELIGTLRERAEKHSLTTAVQPARYVDVFKDETTFSRVIPTVGVPDSESFQTGTGALAPVLGKTPKQIVLLYESLTVAKAWRAHLDWLDGYLPVRTVKAVEVDQWLANL
jgi:hypothetical protein